MIKQFKINQKIKVTLTTGIIALAVYGSYNTVSSALNASSSHDFSEKYSTTIYQDTSYSQNLLSGCPGDCTTCGLCTGIAATQIDVINHSLGKNLISYE